MDLGEEQEAGLFEIVVDCVRSKWNRYSREWKWRECYATLQLEVYGEAEDLLAKEKIACVQETK